jgi:hypothetical protein
MVYIRRLYCHCFLTWLTIMNNLFWLLERVRHFLALTLNLGPQATLL